jgi:hypothetical protein
VKVLLGILFVLFVGWGPLLDRGHLHRRTKGSGPPLDLPRVQESAARGSRGTPSQVGSLPPATRRPRASGGFRHITLGLATSKDPNAEGQ